jgi:glycine/D-amino acid oxidase-like deaminating enzyme
LLKFAKKAAMQQPTEPTQRTFAPPVVASTSAKVPPWPVLQAGQRVVVVGAGAFGGWTALFLQRAGFKVSLVDTWGAGNSRSSSGDETRVSRSTYGANGLYFRLNVRAQYLWKSFEKALGQAFFYQSGALWCCYRSSEPFIEASKIFMEEHGLAYRYLSIEEAQRKFPLLSTDGLDHLVFDPSAGYLLARSACMAVKSLFVKEGGQYIQQMVSRPDHVQGVIQLADGSRLNADAFIFACGPWLGQLFPDLAQGRLVSTSRQEVYYFGTPPGMSAQFEDLPVWIDWDPDEDFYYGIPASGHRGFKVANDLRGEEIDPDQLHRVPSEEGISKARQFLTRRFPALASMPVVESRVCQYENSSDGNLIFDRHPSRADLWLLGGGSGHGYKHGPALGELVADTLIGKRLPEPLFLLRE